jgi:hypothetical protein
MDLGACDSAAVHAFNAQTCAQTQCSDCVRQHLRRDTGIDEGSEEHIARDPGKTVKVGNAHKNSLLQLYSV